jgi:hypothetical protein
VGTGRFWISDGDGAAITAVLDGYFFFPLIVVTAMCSAEEDPTTLRQLA